MANYDTFYTVEGNPVITNIHTIANDTLRQVTTTEMIGENNQNFWRAMYGIDNKIAKFCQDRTAQSYKLQRFANKLSTRRYSLLHNRGDELYSPKSDMDFTFRPCPCCLKHKETFAHFMFQCPSTKELRTTLKEITATAREHNNNIETLYNDIIEAERNYNEDGPTAQDIDYKTSIHLLLGRIEYQNTEQLEKMKVVSLLIEILQQVAGHFYERLADDKRRIIVEFWKDELQKDLEQ